MSVPPFVRPFGLEDKIEHARKRVEEAELRADLNPEDVAYQLALDARRVELAILEHAMEVKKAREAALKPKIVEVVIDEDVDEDDDIDLEKLEALLMERARVRRSRERS